MIGTFEVDNKGKVTNSSPSAYSPSKEVKDLIARIKQDYSVGDQILNRSFREFNDRSILQVMDDDQKAFNTYIPPKSMVASEAWRAFTVRPVTRNKIISIAAHATASLIYPNVFAQNSDDEEDKDAANVMRDLIEWTIKNSDYELTFLYTVVSALINPCVYLKADYSEVMQTVKEKVKGKIVTKEVIDDVLSGFRAMIVPVEEMLITNAYEFEIQRQRALGRRRFIEHDEAKSLYGKHADFKHVNPGIRAIYNDSDSAFYDQKDDQLTTLVEEFTYYNRTEDLELVFMNGVLMCDKDRPMKHRDLKGRPKYPFAKTGYEPIDEKRFFFYKSCVSKLAPDQKIVDRLWNTVLDGSFLSLMPPIALFGDEEVDSGVMMPGSVTSFAKNTKIQPINTGMNLSAGYTAIQTVEDSMTESSQDRNRSGAPVEGNRTAFEIARMEQNARIQMGLFGKMIGKLVTDFGYLMIHDIVHHMTVADVEEITGGDTRTKFRSFLLPNKTDGGKKVTTEIRLESDLLGKDMTEDDVTSKGYEIMDQEGGIDGDRRIYLVNPELFSKFEFKVTVSPDNMTPVNEAFQKAMNLEAYDRLIANPLVDQEAVTQDFLVETFAKGESSKYMKKAEEITAPQEEAPPTDGTGVISKALGGLNARALMEQI